MNYAHALAQFEQYCTDELEQEQLASSFETLLPHVQSALLEANGKRDKTGRRIIENLCPEDLRMYIDEEEEEWHSGPIELVLEARKNIHKRICFIPKTIRFSREIREPDSINLIEHLHDEQRIVIADVLTQNTQKYWNNIPSRYSLKHEIGRKGSRMESKLQTGVHELHDRITGKGESVK